MVHGPVILSTFLILKAYKGSGKIIVKNNNNNIVLFTYFSIILVFFHPSE